MITAAQQAWSPRRRSKKPWWQRVGKSQCSKWRLTIVTTTRLCGAQIDVLNRDCADTFAGCGKDGVEDCGCGHRNCRLADPAPEFAVWHDYGLDLRHRVETHHLPGIEISLLDATVAHRAFAVQQRRESVNKRALDLASDLLRIDRVTTISGADYAVHFHLSLID